MSYVFLGFVSSLPIIRYPISSGLQQVTNMVSRALRILVVSEDRQHLRDCFDFFVACGYEVETRCGDPRQPYPPAECDVLICDDRGTLPVSTVSSRFKIVIVDENLPGRVAQAIADGADDVVAGPVTPAKLLVRVRAAATTLDARLATWQQFGRPPQNIHPGEGAFLGTLQQMIEQIGKTGNPLGASLFFVDTDSPQLYRRWLDEVAASMLPDARLFELPGKRVGVLTPTVQPEQVRQWTQQQLTIKAALHDTTHAEQAAVSISASFISICGEGGSSQQIALVLTDRLNLALSLGQGILIDDVQESQWLPEHPSGSIFDGMTAEDIMRPTTLQFDENEPLASVLEQMRLWGVDVAPVRRGSGDCGVVCVEDLTPTPDQSKTLASLSLPSVPQVEPEMAFEQFVALFSSHDSAWIQVVRGGQPLGIIHCDDLTSMNSPIMVALPD